LMPGLIYGDSYERTSSDQLLYKKARSHRWMWYGMFTHHQAMVYKRSVIADLAYKGHYPIGADYAFTIEALMKEGTAVYIQSTLECRKSKCGNKLDIHRLAEEFGVSRSPVKDAINQLVHDGLIEIIPRKGTYVTELNFTAFIEVLDARLMIEQWAAGQMINNIPIEAIEKWGEIVAEMDTLLEITPFPFEKYSDLDNHFHMTLIKWTGNSKIVDMFSSLNTHVSLSRIVHSTSLESTIKRHKDLGFSMKQ